MSLSPTAINSAEQTSGASIKAAKKYSDVMVAHAQSNENGKATGGVAGDQTGKEVYVRTWYVSGSGWTHVIRPCNDKMAEIIAQIGEAAAANNHIGYDQEKRNELYTLAKKYNFDISKITVDCSCDCSSLVTTACVAAGCPESYFYKSGNCRATSTIRSACEKSGMFTILTDSKYLTEKNYLKRGDILLREPGHVAICVQNGKKVETKTQDVPKGQNVEYYTVTGEKVNLRSGPGREYTDVGTARKGDLLEVVKITGDWAQLSNGNYISAKYLKKV